MGKKTSQLGIFFAGNRLKSLFDMYMKIHKHQIKAMSKKVYAVRMRHFLNQQFPESKAIEEHELEHIILDLTDRAALTN